MRDPITDPLDEGRLGEVHGASSPLGSGLTTSPHDAVPAGASGSGAPSAGGDNPLVHGLQRALLETTPEAALEKPAPSTIAARLSEDGVEATLTEGGTSLSAGYGGDGVHAGVKRGSGGLSIQAGGDGELSGSLKLGRASVGRSDHSTVLAGSVPLSHTPPPSLRAAPLVGGAAPKAPPERSLSMSGRYNEETGEVAAGGRYTVGDRSIGGSMRIGSGEGALSVSASSGMLSVGAGASLTSRTASSATTGVLGGPVYETAVTKGFGGSLGASLCGLGGKLSGEQSTSTLMQSSRMILDDARVESYAAGRPLRPGDLAPGESLVQQQDVAGGASWGLGGPIVAQRSSHSASQEQRTIAREPDGSFMLQSTHLDVSGHGTESGLMVKQRGESRTDQDVRQVRYRVSADSESGRATVQDFADFGLLPGAEQAAAADPDSDALLAELETLRERLAWIDGATEQASEEMRPLLWQQRRELIASSRALIADLNRGALSDAAIGQTRAPAASLESYATLQRGEHTQTTSTLMGRDRDYTMRQQAQQEIATDDQGGRYYRAARTRSSGDQRSVITASGLRGADDALRIETSRRDGAQVDEITLSADVLDQLGADLSAGEDGVERWQALAREAVAGAGMLVVVTPDELAALSAMSSPEAFTADSDHQELFVRAVLLCRGQQSGGDADFLASRYNPLELTAAIGLVVDPVVRGRLLEAMGVEMAVGARDMVDRIARQASPETADALAASVRSEGALEDAEFSLAAAAPAQQARRLEEALNTASISDLFDYLYQVRKLYGAAGMQAMFAASSAPPERVWAALASGSTKKPARFVDELLAGTPQQAALRSWLAENNTAAAVNTAGIMRAADAQARQDVVVNSNDQASQLRSRHAMQELRDAREARLAEMLASEQARQAKYRASREAIPRALAEPLMRAEQQARLRDGGGVAAILESVRTSQGVEMVEVMVEAMDRQLLREMLEADYSGALAAALEGTSREQLQ